MFLHDCLVGYRYAGESGTSVFAVPPGCVQMTSGIPSIEGSAGPTIGGDGMVCGRGGRVGMGTAGQKCGCVGTLPSWCPPRCTGVVGGPLRHLQSHLTNLPLAPAPMLSPNVTVARCRVDCVPTDTRPSIPRSFARKVTAGFPHTSCLLHATGGYAGKAYLDA